MYVFMCMYVCRYLFIYINIKTKYVYMYIHPAGTSTRAALVSWLCLLRRLPPRLLPSCRLRMPAPPTSPGGCNKETWLGWLVCWSDGLVGRMGLLVGWTVGQLVGWVGWLVGWSVGRMGGFVCCLLGWLAGWVGCCVGRLV